VTKPSDARTQCEYVDINPANGQLLIFDSRLIHAVEKVRNPEKSRVALTLWNFRPEKRSVCGEVYDEGIPEKEYQV
jgi:Rps23 Pro-64 3,4-dihydroxylase Tpa1-like proline 4-hydroxylase